MPATQVKVAQLGQHLTHVDSADEGHTHVHRVWFRTLITAIMAIPSRLHALLLEKGEI